MFGHAQYSPLVPVQCWQQAQFWKAWAIFDFAKGWGGGGGSRLSVPNLLSGVVEVTDKKGFKTEVRKLCRQQIQKKVQRDKINLFPPLKMFLWRRGSTVLTQLPWHVPWNENTVSIVISAPHLYVNTSLTSELINTVSLSSKSINTSLLFPL